MKYCRVRNKYTRLYRCLVNGFQLMIATTENSSSHFETLNKCLDKSYINTKLTFKDNETNR